MIYRGRWTARVEQDFEIEAASRSEFESFINDEMSPRMVVELMDFEYTISDIDGSDIDED
jgi:hypothetical protein